LLVSRALGFIESIEQIMGVDGVFKGPVVLNFD